MAKKEAKTDLWVARQLDDSKIKYDAQGSDVKEINDALQSASKRGTGNAGYPEYVAVVKDFVIVIEDKADLAKHQKLTDTGILSTDQKDIADYAVNGAYFYAKHIAESSGFHKIFAIGVSGDEKHHKITPLYVDDRDGYKQLPDIESFTSFTTANIDEYYTRYVLAEKTDVEKTTEEILKDAAELHEYLRTYGSLKDQDKPLVVSGILLALDDMFAIAATNMILRDDGNSNIKCEDFLRQNSAQVQLKGATVGMMNPPYSQGTKADPSQYELSFVEHLLDSLTEGARAAVIVPQSSMTGKTKDEQTFKENILKHHTLEGVITCNTDTFYGVGTNPVIAVFTAHEPHPDDKICKFIDFRNDGYEVRAHVGLVEGDSAKDKKQHLLDVWFGRTKAASKFCVESTVKASDEWLHSYFYFNDEIPTDADFEKSIGDYLTFEFSMIMQNREYLFEGGDVSEGT